MLTDQDIVKLKRIFVTKEEFKKELHDIRSDFLARFDALMFELKAIREEITVFAYRQRDHEDRIELLEQKIG